MSISDIHLTHLVRTIGHFVGTFITAGQAHLADFLDTLADRHDLYGFIQMFILDPKNISTKTTDELSGTIGTPNKALILC